MHYISIQNVYIIYKLILNHRKTEFITLIGFESTLSLSNICTIHVILRARGKFFCASNANDRGYT